MTPRDFHDRGCALGPWVRADTEIPDFGHDAFGNVWRTSESGVLSLRQTGSSWYLIGGSTVNNRLSGTSYDAMGNQTQLSVSAGTVASYDGENRPAKCAVGGAEIREHPPEKPGMGG